MGVKRTIAAPGGRSYLYRTLRVYLCGRGPFDAESLQLDGVYDCAGTPVEAAYYHNADSIAHMIESHDSSVKESSGPRKRGQSAGWAFCECCLAFITGVYFNCAVCGDIKLCFKCYKSKSSIHPHHEFNDAGYEWDSDDTVSEKAESEDGSGLDSEDAEPVIEFDDEIVGEDDPETEEALPAGGGIPSA
ncbi:uncharacterized protein DNG_06786 [Cephalotrichum gorgonifer]|uniref:ZZ-type domain-containing protein n=1 Tax=Cephalotrichum gorgonifer TaxID=2041049 RepID=A0AAE8N344_9PEZI|nr:uncharacterized protein DNG_06786 [Cephalotrichum gorgonifer]